MARFFVTECGCYGLVNMLQERPSAPVPPSTGKVFRKFVFAWIASGILRFFSLCAWIAMTNKTLSTRNEELRLPCVWIFRAHLEVVDSSFHPDAKPESYSH
jgi:hypothetical protein